MDQKVKERLLGAIVLAILVIALVPVLFISKKEQEPVTKDSIPVPQHGRLSSKLVPIQPINMLPVKTEEAASATVLDPAKEAVRSADSVPKAEQYEDKAGNNDESAPALVAWVIQLGSFSSRENAVSLSKDLRAAGYTAFIESIGQGDERVHRVRVGPELLRADAEILLKKLDTTLGLKGVILNYP